MENRKDRIKKIITVASLPGWASFTWHWFWELIAWVGNIELVHEHLPWVGRISNMLTLPILAILVGILGCLYLGVIVLYGNHPRIASWKFQVVASIVLLGIPVIWAISYKPKLSASTVKSSQDTKISEQYSPTTDTATQNTNQENHGTVDSAQAIPIHHGTSDQTQAQVTRKPKAPDTQQTPAIGNVVQGAGSAFSVNQSGGVTAGTYNNFVPPQRTLSGNDQTAFIDALRPKCPFEVAVRGIPGNEESLEYARQIGEAIKAAGCSLKRPKFLIDTAPSYGVSIVIHDIKDIPAGADALTEAFFRAHIKLNNQPLDAIEQGSVYVMVGFNESKQ